MTLGSQEGAFENVRMNYSGDQGQQIRQLINSHYLRRVAMCVLASPHGKRQHLAVSHEKGKITILQLSALLKQADSSKKKLTLTVSLGLFQYLLGGRGGMPINFRFKKINSKAYHHSKVVGCFETTRPPPPNKFAFLSSQSLTDIGKEQYWLSDKDKALIQRNSLSFCLIINCRW